MFHYLCHFFTPILMLMNQWSVPVVLLSRTVYSKLWKNELRTVRNCEKMRHALYQNLKKWVAHCSKLWKTLVAHCSLWFQNCGKMSRTLFINKILKKWVTRCTKFVKWVATGRSRVRSPPWERSLDLPQRHQVLVLGPGNGLESVYISLRLSTQSS